MTLAQKIHAQIENLPETYQAEVLDFVEFLAQKAKRRPASDDDESAEWSRFALFHLTQGLEDDQVFYSLEDVREAL
ncbi:MAG: DUF2281 domain-containing protein [Thermoanaerobaculia bacterium]|nr:DUF2281 domain-containing protein [Thermoanaerobaculia bacterium]